MDNMLIKPVQNASMQVTTTRPVEKDEPSDKASFGQWLNKSLEAVHSLQEESDDAAMKLMTGESKDIHGTMVAMQKASISMSLVMEVRNKIISAYDEIKRMQF